MVTIKICGIMDRAALGAAVGADFAGFVFHPASSRFLKPETAEALMSHAAPGLVKTGVFVDPDDELLMRIAGVLDLIQLHGTETPQRVAEVARLTGLPVMKALTVSSGADVERASAYESVAERLLFDAGAGGGRTFDWGLLKDFQSPLPWMLAGGLNAGNVKSALEKLRPDGVDVSGGAESAPGRKDPVLIRQFIEIVRNFNPAP